MDPTTPHLRAVDEAPPDLPDDGGSGRSQRSRPSRPIMTDRLKFEVAESILKTVGRLSGPGKKPVGPDLLGQSLSLHPDSARLPLPFFKEAGFLEKSGRSDYKATDALVEFMRNESVGVSRSKVLAPLTEAMKQSWYWTEIESSLRFGPAPKAEIVSTLMKVSGASPHHIDQISNVLLWLEYVGLVTIDDDKVTAAVEVAASADEVDEQPPPAEEQVEKPPADPEVSKPTTGQKEAEFVLSLSLNLTRDDLAALSSDQIAALSGVIHTIATIKTR